MKKAEETFALLDAAISHYHLILNLLCYLHCIEWINNDEKCHGFWKSIIEQIVFHYVALKSEFLTDILKLQGTSKDEHMLKMFYIRSFTLLSLNFQPLITRTARKQGAKSINHLLPSIWHSSALVWGIFSLSGWLAVDESGPRCSSDVLVASSNQIAK